MNHHTRYFFLLHLTLTLLPAQFKPESVCGLPSITPIPLDAPVHVEHLAKSTAITFKIRKDVTTAVKNYITVDFTLMYFDANFEVYAETAQIDSGRIIQENVDTLVQVFRDATFSGSIDSTRGIKSIAESIYGSHPDINGDGKMLILLIDVRDQYEEGVSETFVAGYFDPVDQIGTEANRQDIIYLDTYPADLSGFRAEEVYSTLAHEYQHLIHYGRDPDEHAWVNEGLSELSPVLMGLPHRAFSHYLTDTNVGIETFAGGLGDYARSSLFFLYSWVQLGTDFIRDLIANTGTGRLGFAATLPNHSTMDFASHVENWHLANYIQGSGAHGYGPDWAVPTPLMQKSLYKFPTNIAATVNAYAAHWTLVSHGSNMMLTGSATQNATITIFKGEDRTPIDGSSIVSAGFTDADYGVTYSDLFVLTTAGNLASIYNLNVEAEGYYDEFTLKYDKDQSVFDQVFIGLGDWRAVVEFSIPSAAIDLTSISFLPYSSGPVEVRLYADLFSTSTLFYQDTIPATYQLEWAPYRLPSGIDLSGQKLFVSLNGVPLGYNEAQAQQLSYLANEAYLKNEPGGVFDSLSEFSIDGGITNLEGNWSVRASYLLPGQVPIDTVSEPIVGNFYVNPFIHDGTLASVVRIDVVHEEAVDFRIYNLLGQQVWRSDRPAGDTTPLTWTGVTNEGRSVPSGVYIGVIRAGTLVQKRKLMLIR